jgi:hypothetical protein
MYKMYDVCIYIFLFSIHVVVGVDDFSCFVIFPQSRLVVVCYQLWGTFYVQYYVMPETILWNLIILYIYIYIKF